MVRRSESIVGTEKEFLDIFKTLCYSRSSWEVWADVITAIACSLSNAIDRSPEHYEPREKEFEQCIKRLGSVEVPAKLLGVIMMALENNPEQDFLGAMYMKLELGNHWKGQFFTPYSVSRMMADVNLGNCVEEVEAKGWISVCDSCVGGGAMLIAAANTMQRQNINYQNHTLFVGQDIDRVVAMMAYIQLSLLGCPGYIIVGNSLTNPMTGSVLFPKEGEGQEYWYTPMFNSKVWHWRRIFNSLDLGNHSGTGTTRKTVEKEHFYMYFDFTDKEVQHERQEFIAR